MLSCGRFPAETSVPSDAANSSAAVSPAASTTPELPVVAMARTNLDVDSRSLSYIYKRGCDVTRTALKLAGVSGKLRRPLTKAAGTLAVYVHFQKTLAEHPEADGPEKEPMVGAAEELEHGEVAPASGEIASQLIKLLLGAKTCNLRYSRD